MGYQERLGLSSSQLQPSENCSMHSEMLFWPASKYIELNKTRLSCSSAASLPDFLASGLEPPLGISDMNKQVPCALLWRSALSMWTRRIRLFYTNLCSVEWAAQAKTGVIVSKNDRSFRFNYAIKSFATWWQKVSHRWIVMVYFAAPLKAPPFQEEASEEFLRGDVNKRVGSTAPAHLRNCLWKFELCSTVGYLYAQRYVIWYQSPCSDTRYKFKVHAEHVNSTSDKHRHTQFKREVASWVLKQRM